MTANEYCFIVNNGFYIRWPAGYTLATGNSGPLVTWVTIPGDSGEGSYASGNGTIADLQAIKEKYNYNPGEDYCAPLVYSALQRLPEGVSSAVLEAIEQGRNVTSSIIRKRGLEEDCVFQYCNENSLCQAVNVGCHDCIEDSFMVGWNQERAIECKYSWTMFTLNIVTLCAAWAYHGQHTTGAIRRACSSTHT